MFLQAELISYFNFFFPLLYNHKPKDFTWFIVPIIGLVSINIQTLNGSDCFNLISFNLGRNINETINLANPDNKKIKNNMLMKLIVMYVANIPPRVAPIKTPIPT